MTIDDRRHQPGGRPGSAESLGSADSPRAAERAARSVAAIDFGSWPDIEARLLARLVPAGRAGPLHRWPARPGSTDRSDPPAVVLDLGVDLEGGIVRPDRSLLEAWSVDPERLWQTASDNLARLPEPVAVTVSPGPAPLRVLSGGPWTTGRLLLPDRLPVGRSSTVVAAAPAAGLLVLAESPPSSGHRHPGVGPTPALVEPLLELAHRLAQAASDRLPLEPLEPAAIGSFPAPRFLE